MRIILIFIIILVSTIQIRTSLLGPDSINYYSIAKSLSFDRNLMFNNEFEARGYHMTITPTYHIAEHHQISASLVWMFIFDFLKSIGVTQEHNLRIAINLTEYLLGILALIFIFKICIKFFEPRTAFLSILAVLLGTNFFAYITVLSGASHASNIFFISCFLLFYFNTYKERAKIDWLILGGLSGFMLMARRDSGLYLIFPVFDLFRYIKNKNLKIALSRSLIFILGLLFTFSPQISFWKIIFGKIFSRPLGESDYFTGNEFLKVLFSSYRGFFFFSPFVGLCFVIGLFYLYKKEKILTFSSIFIFLTLVYGVGKLNFIWSAGTSFGGRYFLIFVPLFILSVASCFKRLSLKNQIIIAVISALWSFFLFVLHICGKELYSYKSIIYMLNFDFFYKILQYIYGFFKNITFKFVFLKSIFLMVILLSVLLLWGLSKRIRISQMLLKKISIYSVGVIIIYIHIIFIECYFNDKKVISQLQKEDFYKDTVFGEFDKGDTAETYLEYAVEQIREGHIGLAIDSIRRAMHLYPPYQEECFEYLYAIYTDHPKDFNVELLNKSDAFDYLGLSLKFYEKGDFAKAKYYFQEAVGLKPDIVEVAKSKRDHYLSSRLDKVGDFYFK